MKILRKISVNMKALFALLMLCLLQTVVWAQDKKEVDININTKNDNWYAQPWVWIVGGAVFLLLLVALLRGGGRKD